VRRRTKARRRLGGGARWVQGTLGRFDRKKEPKPQQTHDYPVPPPRFGDEPSACAMSRPRRDRGSRWRARGRVRRRHRDDTKPRSTERMESGIGRVAPPLTFARWENETKKNIKMQLTGLRGRAGSKNNLLDSNSYYPSSRPPRPPLRLNVSRAGNNGVDVSWSAIVR
jgi:hypothetical protein